MGMTSNSGRLKAVLVRYFSALGENDIEYCVIGNYADLPDYTSNDVDMWVDDIPKAEELLLESAKDVGLQLYIRNQTANGSNNYFYAYEQGAVEIVKIDLMRELAYRSIFPIVDSEQIRRNRSRYKDFFVANEVIEGAMHLLYPLATFGEVKEKYREKLRHLASNREFGEVVGQILGEKLASRIIPELQTGMWSSIEQQSGHVRNKLIRRALSTLDLERLKIIGEFGISLVRRAFKKNGIVIGFTGIDGAGKSSIKTELMRTSDRYFTKNRKLEHYWRPFLLPRISKFTGGKGQNEVYDGSGKRLLERGRFHAPKNAAKYMYYVADFVLGQISYFKVCHTGGIVIFDRYHFDNIIYPERFGFNVNKRLMRLIDRVLVPQPDVLFYFTANTETLFERKREIDIDEINQQKGLYESEIKRRTDVVVVQTDGTFDDSIQEVLLNCFAVMNRRYQ